MTTLVQPSPRFVQTRDLRAFDDYSDNRLTLNGVRVQRHLLGSAQISVYYARYARDAAVFASVSGNERREIVDGRFSGAAKGFDWDVEGMNQAGRIGDEAIHAWAFGSLVGYTSANVGWTPHLGLGVDVATGDHNPHDNRLETFNPLFPNGYYLCTTNGAIVFDDGTASLHRHLRTAVLDDRVSSTSRINLSSSRGFVR